MNTETDKITQEVKINQRSHSLESHSSRSEKFGSASKSLKAFEGSLRKQDSNNVREEKFNSPLKKRLNFGKNEQPQSKSNDKKYFVDTLKKIKKVESPFQHKHQVEVYQDKIQVSETNLLISCFDSISQKVEGQSSIQQEKIKSFQSPIDCDIENVQIQQCEIECEEDPFKIGLQQPYEIEVFSQSKQSMMQIEICSEREEKMEEEKSSEKQQLLEGSQSDEGVQSSSVISSVQSKASDRNKLRKELKIKKRKEKKSLAKKMKIKLRNITNFVDELHQKNTHTNRKSLVTELSEHLWERKFTRLRKELKKLI